jgi:hypothetical protein
VVPDRLQGSWPVCNGGREAADMLTPFPGGLGYGGVYLKRPHAVSCSWPGAWG